MRIAIESTIQEIPTGVSGVGKCFQYVPPKGYGIHTWYFHNKPFINGQKIFCQLVFEDLLYQATLDLYTGGIQTVSSGEMYRTNSLGVPVEVARSQIYDVNNEILYQQFGDTLHTLDSKSLPEILIDPRLGKDWKFHAVNCVGNLLVGTFSDEGKAGEYLDRAHLGRSYVLDLLDATQSKKIKHHIFTYNLATSELRIVHSGYNWFNHLQFSPKDPYLLMFCHEGPWERVDRIWFMDVYSGRVTLGPISGEIGHEFWHPSGNSIFHEKYHGDNYERQSIVCMDVLSGSQEFSHELPGISCHLNTNKDGTYLCTEGSSSFPEIGICEVSNDSFQYMKVMDMSGHNYHAEPNAHISPSDDSLVFTYMQSMTSSICNIVFE